MRIYRQPKYKNVKFHIHSGDIEENYATKQLIAVALRADLRDKNWYQNAHDFAKELSEKYQISLDTVCQVIAVLSPMTEWGLNKRQATKCIESWTYGVEVPCSMNYAFTQKAYDILDGKRVLEDSQYSKKTYRFYRNILDVNNQPNVCIDSHAVSVLVGFTNYTGSYKITGSEYLKAEKIYQQVAKLFNLKPGELQAIVWEQAKREKTESLTEFVTQNGDSVVGTPLNLLSMVQ